MLKRKLILVFVFFTSQFALAKVPTEKIYECEYKLRGYISGEISVSVRDGKLQNFDYEGYFAPLRPGAGFACGWSGNRSKPSMAGIEEKWEEQGGATKITYYDKSSPFDESDFVMAKITKSGISLDFRKIHSGMACGAGAAMPTSLYLSFSSKRCKVRMPDL